MVIKARIRSLWRNLVHRDQADQELDEEVRSYLEQLVIKKISEGMTPEEAQRSARISFGGVEQVKEEVRAVQAGRLLDDLARDIRLAFRTLAKSPGFTTVAILTLALGLAASTAIFSVINGVLLQPLDYPNAGQLVAIQQLVPKLVRKFPMIPINPAAYLAWSHQAKSLAGIGVVGEGVTMNLTGGGEPALLSADAVTANLFDVLGIQPQLGRSFLPDGDQVGHNHEVILTDALWQSRFHGDPSIVGHAIALNGSRYTVVGILPPSFHFPHGDQLSSIGGPTAKPELFVPEVFEKWELAPDAGFGFGCIARLRPGVSRAEATAELNVILRRRLGSQTFMPNPRTVMIPLRDMIVRSSKQGLWLLLAAVRYCLSSA